MSLPSFDPNDNEAGMKLLEELTTNTHLLQQHVLEDILTTNATTQHLSTFLNGLSDKKLFKTNLPIIDYEYIQPYIERIANGEKSDIISAKPIIEFLTRYHKQMSCHKFIYLFIYLISVLLLLLVQYRCKFSTCFMQLGNFRRGSRR